MNGSLVVKRFFVLNFLEKFMNQPATNDRRSWAHYWQAQDQLWRTEPEIDLERQAFLAEHRMISSDVERGHYPFKDIKLGRADIEWLLATHEQGRGPVDWSDEQQHERIGLDLRGADLRLADLQGLPLARMLGGLPWSEWLPASVQQRDRARIHLEEAQLNGVHLESAALNGAYLTKALLYEANMERTELGGAHLQMSVLARAQLQEADLIGAHMDHAYLNSAHLEGAYLTGAHMRDIDLSYAYLGGAHLEGANLSKAHLEMAYLSGRYSGAQLEGADLSRTHLEGANLRMAHLEGAHLHRAHFELADLREAHFEGSDLSYAYLEGTHMDLAHFGSKIVDPDDLARIRRWVEDFPESLPEATINGTLLEK